MYQLVLFGVLLNLSITGFASADEPIAIKFWRMFKLDGTVTSIQKGDITMVLAPVAEPSSENITHWGRIEFTEKLKDSNAHLKINVNRILRNGKIWFRFWLIVDNLTLDDEAILQRTESEVLVKNTDDLDLSAIRQTLSAGGYQSLIVGIAKDSASLP